MQIRELTDLRYRSRFNELAPHPLQAWEWGEFREKTGVRVVRYGLFKKDELIETVQVTLHPIPYTSWTVGYFPKGRTITREITSVLATIAKDNNCIYIKCEPKIEEKDARNFSQAIRSEAYVPGRPLFTRYNFILDVSKSEEELLSAMKQKTRYNIRVAEKKGVTVSLSTSPADFERYLHLTEETTQRQRFYAHSQKYHRLMWETLSHSPDPSSLSSYLLTVRYNNETITTWVLFRLNDTLYYPYGASTREHRNVMANNLVMWEAIRLAKKMKLHYFDMWGALGPDPDPQDPWYGFHTFKLGYGARHVMYVGTWDYVAKPLLYRLYRLGENVRWMLLRLFR